VEAGNSCRVGDGRVGGLGFVLYIFVKVLGYGGPMFRWAVSC
jgi:hypothetical protein